MAWAECDSAVCVKSPAATAAEVLASPGATLVTERIMSIADGPFSAKTAYYGAGWESYQYGSVFSRDGVTRTSARAFEASPGKVTYLDARRSCSRTVTKKYPNTLTADADALWKCRSRKASDVDGTTWLRRWLPAANLPSTLPAGAWFIDYTDKPTAVAEGRSLEMAVESTTTWYEVKASGIDLGRVIRFYELDDSSAQISTAAVPKLPAMSRFRVDGTRTG